MPRLRQERQQGALALVLALVAVDDQDGHDDGCIGEVGGRGGCTSGAGCAALMEPRWLDLAMPYCAVLTGVAGRMFFRGDEANARVGVAVGACAGVGVGGKLANLVLWWWLG